MARALLEKETIDGAEVGRLVDQAAGRVVRPEPGAPDSLKDLGPNGIDDGQPTEVGRTRGPS